MNESSGHTTTIEETGLLAGALLSGATLSPTPRGELQHGLALAGPMPAIRMYVVGSGSSEVEDTSPMPSESSGVTIPVASPDYAVTIGRILELQQEPIGDDDDEPTRPTAYAVTVATQLLKAVAERIPQDFPRGSASVAEDGGLRVSWARFGRELRIVIPGQPGGRAYIYRHERPPLIDTEISAERLASYLRWVALAS